MKKNPELNLMGVKDLLNPILFHDGKECYFQGYTPRIYKELKQYHSEICNIINKRELHRAPNCKRILLDLKQIQENYA